MTLIERENKALFSNTEVLFRYWMLDVSKVYTSGSNAWDAAVRDASEEYKHRMVKCVSVCVLARVREKDCYKQSPLFVFFLFSFSTTFVVITVTRTLLWH